MTGDMHGTGLTVRTTNINTTPPTPADPDYIDSEVLLLLEEHAEAHDCAVNK